MSFVFSKLCVHICDWVVHLSLCSVPRQSTLSFFVYKMLCVLKRTRWIKNMSLLVGHFLATNKSRWVIFILDALCVYKPIILWMLKIMQADLFSGWSHNHKQRAFYTSINNYSATIFMSSFACCAKIITHKITQLLNFNFFKFKIHNFSIIRNTLNGIADELFYE